MIERPILFQDRLVRALLRDENPKTQTRRVGPGASRWLKMHRGDRLWVREAWMPLPLEEVVRLRQGGMVPGPWNTQAGGVLYRATAMAPAFDYLAAVGHKWRPSIFMPRAASRITLELTQDPTLEHLAAITEEDAIAEGVEPADLGYGFGMGWKGAQLRYNTARGAFQSLWDNIQVGRSIYSWANNPNVVVLRFKRL